jgi:hypothetical protein
MKLKRLDIDQVMHFGSLEKKLRQEETYDTKRRRIRKDLLFHGLMDGPRSDAIAASFRLFARYRPALRFQGRNG